MIDGHRYIGGDCSIKLADTRHWRVKEGDVFKGSYFGTECFYRVVRLYSIRKTVKAQLVCSAAAYDGLTYTWSVSDLRNMEKVKMDEVQFKLICYYG